MPLTPRILRHKQRENSHFGSSHFGSSLRLKGKKKTPPTASRPVHMPKDATGVARRGDIRAKPSGPPGLPDVDLTTELPGVPESSDEDRDDNPPKRVKDHVGSPKTAGRDSSSVTLADMQRLLENQSRILQEHQSRQIKEAVAELRQTTSAQIGTIREEVARHGDYIEQLRDQGEKMEMRLAALEGGVGHVPLHDGNEGTARKNVVVFGGWGPDTHRDALLPELKELLQKINLLDSFEDIFTTGPRRGNALGIVSLRALESDQDLKRRIITMVQSIRQAQMSSKSMEPGKNLWASLSKTKSERVRSAHAGKLKRLILEVDEAMKNHLDVEWNAGSVWVRGNLVGSVLRAKPVASSTISAGKMPSSWVDLSLLARLLGCSDSDLKDRWEALIES